MQTTFFLNAKRLLYIALLLWQGTALAQAPALTWQKSFGGDSSDYAGSIQQTSDGGYIIAGSSNSINGDVTGNHGDSDYWIVKLDADGTLAWQKTLGGSSDDAANAIQQTTDGGYIVAGTSASIDGDVTGNHGYDDYWIVKLDANGNLTWQKSLGGSIGDVAAAIQQTTDGGYIVAGYSYSNDGDVIGNHGYEDDWIIKLDANGNLSWQKSLGGSSSDHANSIQQCTDGGYIVAGFSMSLDGDVIGSEVAGDYWMVKLDANGNLSWQKSLGGSGFDNANSIQQTTDGGYVVAGYSESNDGDVIGNQGYVDSWIVKLDANGNLSWQKSLGGSTSDWAYSIEQITDGGYIVAGASVSNDGDVTGNHGSGDYWIVKLTASGTLSWQKCLGGSGSEESYSIQQTTDGGYIVAGYSNSMDGDVTGNHGGLEVWIVKLKNFGVSIEEGSMVRDLIVSPNPATGNSLSLDYYLSSATAVEINLIDLSGNSLLCIDAGLEAAGKQSHIINIARLASGVYVLELRTEYSQESVKWVKE